LTSLFLFRKLDKLTLNQGIKMQPQSVQIKDVILNIVKAKKQRDSLKRELDLLNAQIEQQTKFLEESVIEELISFASNQDKQPGPPKKDKD
jgi:hypothetical protein